VANAVRCSSTVRSPAPIVFTATWVAPGQVYHDVQKLVGADTERGAAIPPSTALARARKLRNREAWRPAVAAEHQSRATDLKSHGVR